MYSLGCTLYFLLAGRPPFPGGTIGRSWSGTRLDEPEPLAKLRPDGAAGGWRRCVAQDDGQEAGGALPDAGRGGGGAGNRAAYAAGAPGPAPASGDDTLSQPEPWPQVADPERTQDSPARGTATAAVTQRQARRCGTGCWPAWRGSLVVVRPDPVGSPAARPGQKLLPVRATGPPAQQPSGIPAGEVHEQPGHGVRAGPQGQVLHGRRRRQAGRQGGRDPPRLLPGEYEVTQEEWEKVTGHNPSHFSRTGGGTG